MPLSAWQGRSDRPGEAAGHGPVDADTCRDLARGMSASPATRWCLTITDDNGKAVGHACIPDGRAKGPPGSAAWLDSLTITWLERGGCTHERESRSYRPGRALRHLVKIRQRTCASPGCRRPAEQCDDDHTKAWDQGGRHLRVQPRPGLPPGSQVQAGPRLAPHPDRARPPHLDHPQRPPVHSGAGQLSRLNGGQELREGAPNAGAG